jgi:hypothetical protein
VKGVSRAALVRKSLWGITRRTRVARIPICRRRVRWICVGRITVGSISVNRVSVEGITVYRVAVIGAWWRWRRRRDSPKYPGCPSDRCSERGPRPAARRRSNSSAGSRSQKAATEAALDRIIRVCAPRKAQPPCGDQERRGSHHRGFPRPVIHSKRSTRFCGHLPIAAGLAVVGWRRPGSPRCRTRPGLS